MGITYSTATKTARMQAVADRIDLGAGAGVTAANIGTTASDIGVQYTVAGFNQDRS